MSIHGFLGGLTLVCAGACIYLAVKPLAFFAEFLLSCGLVFKGTWLLQVGFMWCTKTGCRFVTLTDSSASSGSARSIQRRLASSGSVITFVDLCSNRTVGLQPIDTDSVCRIEPLRKSAFSHPLASFYQRHAPRSPPSMSTIEFWRR